MGKKNIPIVAVILVLALLSGCGKSPQSSDGEETDAVATVEEQRPEGPRESWQAELLEDNASSQEAENELIGYIEQAEALVSAAFDEIETISVREDVSPEELFEQMAEIAEPMLPDLSSLQQQTDSVSGIPAELKNAANEYFSMEDDVWTGFYEACIFMKDYAKFAFDVIALRPDASNYDVSTIDYHTDLDEWYKSAKEAYTAIDTCPSCMEAEWDQYGSILDLNNNISNKAHWAGYYNDVLRWQSVINMSERYNTAVSLQYDKFLSCIIGEMEHVDKQVELATSLAEEMYAYVKSGTEERGGYEFTNIYSGEIITDDDAFEVVDTIYPSLYNTYDAFAIIKTGCLCGTREIIVEAEIPGFTQNYKESFKLDSTYREIKIKPPALTGDLNLSSAKEAQIRLSITDKDGSSIVEKSFPVTIKSKYDFEWIGGEYGVATKDNILSFLTPESSSILELKRMAIEEMANISDGQMESFVGYQNNRWNNHFVGTYLQAAGIMQALHDLGVRYNNTSFSISNSNQRILLPDDVLKQQSGLCIETSLVVASALQAAGMHAFIVLPPGHAQVAVEVWNGSGDDVTGTGQYLLIETTNLNDNLDAYVAGIESLLNNKGPGSGPVTYINREGWKEYLAVEGTYLIDCDDSRVLGLTPFVN